MYAAILSTGAKFDSTRYFESVADHTANTPYLVTSTPTLQFQLAK